MKNLSPNTNLHPCPKEVKKFLRDFELAISPDKKAFLERERRLAARQYAEENRRRRAEFLRK